jgi:hypothetical protein
MRRSGVIEPNRSGAFRSRRAVRASAVVHWVSGLGTVAVIPWVLAAMAREREIQTGPFGIRSLAGGPFEQLGIDWMVGLGWTYVGLGVLEVLAGMILWKRRRAGAWLSVGLTPPLIVFWVGFALPFPPLVATLRLMLLWAGRSALPHSGPPTSVRDRSPDSALKPDPLSPARRTLAEDREPVVPP